MTTDLHEARSSLSEPEFESNVPSMYGSPAPAPGCGGLDMDDDEPLHPLNWNLLTGDEAESEWLDLNAGSTGCERLSVCLRL